MFQPGASRLAQTGAIGLLAAAVLLGSGCVKRHLVITSEPSGALVHVNDEEVGRTPVKVPFAYFGTYDVRLRKDGYEPLWTVGNTGNPWWEMPGVDLVMETLPNGQTTVTWHYVLEPSPSLSDGPEADMEAERLQRAATQLREWVSQEDSTPEDQ